MLTRIRNRDQPGNKIVHTKGAHTEEDKLKEIEEIVVSRSSPPSLTASFLAMYATCIYTMTCCCKSYHPHSHTHTHAHTHTHTHTRPDAALLAANLADRLSGAAGACIIM